VHRKKTHRWPAAATAIVATLAAAALTACTPGGPAASGTGTGAGTGAAAATAGAAALATPSQSIATPAAPTKTPPAAATSPAAPASAAPARSTPARPAPARRAPARPVPAPPPARPLPPAQPVLASGARRVTFVNHLSQEIWVAASPDTTHPLTATGWALRPGQSVTITVPNQYNGRFWGRTGCVFHGNAGHCQTGDCDGKFQCTGWGTIPATLAEYNLDAWQHLDFYDISMVDGDNVPMYAYPTSGDAPSKVSPNGCVAAGCTTPVPCPAALQITAAGKVVACESPCAKLGGDQYCCRGQWAPRSQCDPAKWPVDYAAIFKKAEPYAYSYVDDDATSVYTCKGTCNYNIVFGVTPGG
jgi:Thaumatin family